MAVACDLVHFVESDPCEEDRRRAVAEFEGQMSQTPVGRPGDDAREILVVVASPIQKPKKRPDVRSCCGAGTGGRR